MARFCARTLLPPRLAPRCTLVRSLSTAQASNAHRVRRSLLYIPGSNERMLVKSRSVPADTLVYDLEDRKGAAQNMVLQALRAAPTETPELGVRINAPSSERALAGADLEVVLQSERLESLVLPKCESVEDVTFVAEHVAQATHISYVIRTLTRSRPPLSLVLSVESAPGLLRLPQLLRDAQARLADEFRGVAQIAAVLFASEDYCASSGVRRTRERKGLLYPRANMATIAKAMGIQAIVRRADRLTQDMVCIDYKDPAYLQEECAEGAELGFDGKQAIHPAQLDIIARAFSPTEAGTCKTLAHSEIAEAKAIVTAYESASRTQHKGAVGLEHGGRTIMIDAPMLLQAQRTLARARGGYT